MKGFDWRLRITWCKARDSSRTPLPLFKLYPHFQEITMNSKTTINQVRTVIATVLFGAVAAVAALPATAGSSDAPPQLTVKFSDLNISSPQGAAVLFARIKTAAKAVCPRNDDRDLGAKIQMDACVDHAISVAVTQVNAPALSALYTKSTGKQVPTRLAAR
jgi:UrcA family protein